MRYYILEKNAQGGNDYKKYTLEQAKDFFAINEDDITEDDAKYIEAHKAIKTVEDLKEFIETYVNNENGMHYHDYYIEEVEE